MRLGMRCRVLTLACADSLLLAGSVRAVRRLANGQPLCSTRPRCPLPLHSSPRKPGLLGLVLVEDLLLRLRLCTPHVDSEGGVGVEAVKEISDGWMDGFGREGEGGNLVHGVELYLGPICP
jgi:hypothetical protein